ncbi:HIT domain-containing protein [soil metagenome]
MIMEQLWAPWRLAYVANPKPPAAGDDCFLCRGVAGSDDREAMIVEHTSLSVVVLNRFPYNNGHLLIAPLAHKAKPADLTDAETLDLQHLIQKYMTTLDTLMKPEGYNVGLNLGKVAGAGLPGHLHWHLVPRWNGDTNFMPVLSDTRVIVQSLESLWDLLSPNASTMRC